MNKRHRGGQKANTNAVKQGHKRLNANISLSNDRLAFFVDLAREQLDREPTEAEVISTARQWQYAGIDAARAARAAK